MSGVTIRVRREPGCEDLPLPAYQTDGASGMDLLAAVGETVTIEPGAWCMIPTGIRIAVPEGMEAQVRPRSGLAFRSGIGVLNAPGTVDSDYRGVVSVILFNFGKEPFRVRRGDRVAQLVIQRIVRAEWIESAELGETGRDSGGFGSTGV
ncbi:MAG: dUTP diphosphatase [bacterium]|nr:dUTP diphosphatase [bacterium]